MVEERVKLLHGFGLERESSVSEWDEGERARGALVEKGGVADAWCPRGYVALSFCAHDTHQRCTSGPSASESRTVRGWGVVAVKSMSPR